MKPPLTILIHDLDGDRSCDNRTRVGFKVRGKVEIANFSESWPWHTAEEHKNAWDSAKRLATAVAAVTGLKIEESRL